MTVVRIAEAIDADKRRQRARYKVLRLLGVQPKAAMASSHGSNRFRDTLEALGVNPAKHWALCTDRRRLSHWARVGGGA